MACRFLLYCLAIFVAVGCSNHNLAAQANRFSAFPTKLESALDLQGAAVGSGVNLFRNGASLGLGGHTTSPASNLGAQENPQSNAHSVMSFASHRPTQNQKSADSLVRRTTDEADSNSADSSRRPLANASYRIRRGARVESGLFGHAKKRRSDGLVWNGHDISGSNRVGCQDYCSPARFHAGK